MPFFPSSPNKFSPLELAHGLMKAWLKQHEEEAKTLRYIQMAIDSVTPAQAIECFWRAGYINISEAAFGKAYGPDWRLQRFNW